MNFSVERHPDEPIILVTFLSLKNFLTTLPDLHAQVSNLLADTEGEFYRIDNFGDLRLSTSDLALAMGEEERGRSGSATDPRIRHLIVGSARPLSVNILTLPQDHTPDHRTPIFAALEEALAYAREMLRR